jgi:hypothetical protein
MNRVRGYASILLYDQHRSFQWKLGQLQDCTNHCVRALQTAIAGRHTQESLRVAGVDTSVRTGSCLLATINSLLIHIQSARTALCMPKKRSLLELQLFRPNRCFNPPLPPDLLLSYYVSSSKLVCAAYHLQPVQSAAGRQAFSVYQGECQLPYLVDLLHTLNSALHICEELRNKFAVFHDSRTMKALIGADNVYFV